MATICPYCNIEVSESSIEAEDGCCPECGSLISASNSFVERDGIDEYDEEGFDDIDEEGDDDDYVGDTDLDDLFDDVDDEFSEEEFGEDYDDDKF